ncbi:MAG: V-type ATP synthase subunit C [bacterium]|jgi:V/A-type H+-transporting ATPase subunit C
MAGATRYAYAVARVRVLETRLLEKSQIDRMVEAKGAKEALQVLGETGYGTAVAELESIYDYETLLAKELARVYNVARSFYPDPQLVELFTLKYDVYNLKVMLKAHFQGEETKENTLLSGAGNIPRERLQTMLAEENFRDLPPALYEAVEKLMEQFVHSPDPQLIDIILDQAMYEHIHRSVGKMPFLRQLFTHQTDLINIKTFLRVKNLQRDGNFLYQVLLPGGSIKRESFRQLLDEPLETFSDQFSMGPYATIVEEGVREWQEKKNLTRFEKLADDFLLQYLKKNKYVTFGQEPLVGYLLAKENELKLIRMIMVGKLNNLPIEAIRERLRDTYV